LRLMRVVMPSANNDFNTWAAKFMGWTADYAVPGSKRTLSGWYKDGSDELEDWISKDDWNPATSLDDMRLVELKVINTGNGAEYANELCNIVEDKGRSFAEYVATASVQQRKAAIEAIMGELNE